MLQSPFGHYKLFITHTHTHTHFHIHKIRLVHICFLHLYGQDQYLVNILFTYSDIYGCLACCIDSLRIQCPCDAMLQDVFDVDDRMCNGFLVFIEEDNLLSSVHGVKVGCLWTVHGLIESYVSEP